MRNIKLIIEYEGTNYHGWQAQAGSGKPTIQETIEQAVGTITKEKVKVHSSGRTDAGVHALGHAANFTTGSRIPADAWAPALNHVLPPDIRILSSEEVPPDFHSRYSAKGKTYKYLILNRRAPTALSRNSAWHVSRKLNLRNMRLGASYLIGKRDFSAFRGAGCGARTPVRRIKSLAVIKKGDFVEIIIEADAFLMHMARIIVGTLVEVGLGRFAHEDIKRILRSRDRARAGRTAPPHGLYLIKVSY